VASGPSMTTVNFGVYGTQTLATPGLAPSASVTLTFTIPTSPNCFDPNCEFTITADSTAAVIESNEANNIANGFCLG
jgi:subtilase family serine protease